MCFVFKQKSAYEMRISDWSSDVCSSDLDFLNAAAVVETDLEPEALDAWLHALEDAHGRDRSGPRFGDRTLDIDLVLYDERIVEGPGHLRVPRGELRHAFVLRPLAEIVPDMVEPRSGRRLAELWAESPERDRSEEHTSELQSLMRKSYADLCLNKKTNRQ